MHLIVVIKVRPMVDAAQTHPSARLMRTVLRITVFDHDRPAFTASWPAQHVGAARLGFSVT